jgi:corrinoid protein of di/trimethylamine methyltransferase
MSLELYSLMAQSIVDGEDEDAAALARRAIAMGIDPLDAINDGFIAGVERVGQAFSAGDAFLPELVMAGEAMKAAVAVLEPELARHGTARRSEGKVVIGTVAGDIHDIGKTLVATLLSANGFEVHDLGVNVPLEELVAVAQEVEADIIGVSALLTTTMVRQRDLARMMDDLGLRPRIKLMIGGAPVTRSWADEIGADGFSEDAVGAVTVARQLVTATAAA